MSYQVVILSYNHPQITERSVRSAMAWGEKPLLVHNGSRAENVQHLKNLFPEIEHRIVPVNRGYSGGANFGLQEGFKIASRVLFLTNDCELTEAVVEPTQAGVLAPLIWRRKIGDVDSLGGSVNLSTGVALHAREERPTVDPFYVPGSAFWIDQVSFLKLGGFDESFGTYWEDIEMSLRAPAQNVHLGIDPRTRVLHRVGKTCHKDARYTSYLYQRNRLIVCWRYLHSGRSPFLLRYLSSIAKLLWRKAQSRQWSSFHLLIRAVHDGWRMRNLSQSRR